MRSSNVSLEKCFEGILNGIKPVPFKKVAKDSGLEHSISESNKIVISIRLLLKHSLSKGTPLGVKNNNAYVYNGAYWQYVEDSMLENLLQEAVEKMGINWIDSMHFKYKERLLKQLYTNAPSIKGSRCSKTTSINLANGTFDISNGESKFRNFDSKDYFTYQLGFAYNPNATAPMFQQYLDKVLPDKACQKVLAEYLGYLFLNIKLEKVLILFGSGANGKSVFFEIVHTLLGKQNVSSFSLRNLTDINGYYRALLDNKILNYTSELNECLETAVFKQLVSGEPVEARLPNQKPFLLYEYPKFIFNCNTFPIKVEPTKAYFRRFLIVPFNVTIAEHEQDKQLSKKIIKNELSGVFNWILEGMNRLKKNGKFTYSDAINQLAEQFKKESDTVKAFLEEDEYLPDPKEYVLSRVLYSLYREFCIENGFRPVNSKNFKKRLLEDNISIERGNDGQRIYVKKVPKVYKNHDADKNSKDIF